MTTITKTGTHAVILTTNPYGIDHQCFTDRPPGAIEINLRPINACATRKPNSCQIIFTGSWILQVRQLAFVRLCEPDLQLLRNNIKCSAHSC